MSVRHVLLALLSQEAKYGEQLRREYEQTTGGLWPLNVGQVYTTLQRLKWDGLIEPDTSANQRRAKSFRITEGGEQELSGWWGMPPDWTSPPRDQLVMKVLLALRVPSVSVHEVIGDHRRHLARLRDEWTRIKENEAEFDLSLGLAIDAELFRLDSVVRWLDAADHRVRQASSKAGLQCRARIDRGKF
jgi:DNA-binding PadR family transcriptional regulator